MRPRLLDLFCGAGGCSVGYDRAGFDVVGVDMRADFKLCGCMFELPGLRRERWFETSWTGFDLRPPCWHTGQTVTVAGHGVQGREQRLGIVIPQSVREEAMGIDWMNRDELAQAIPPAYTEYLGGLLLDHLAAERAA